VREEKQMQKKAFFGELSKPEYDPIRNRGIEIEIIRQYQAKDDKEPFQTLVKRNLRYVASISRKYMDGDDHDIDIFHAGVLGLITAIRKYDINSNCRLITYAKNWIKNEIDKYRRSRSVVGLTNYMCWHLRKIDIVIDDLRKAGQSHTDEAISSVAGLSSKSVAAAQKARKARYVIDHPLDCKGVDSVGYFTHIDEGSEPINSLVKSENIERLRNALDALSADEAFVIGKLYFDDDCTRESFRGLAKKMNCSYERVRKLKMSAFDKIATDLAWDI
jgi:RNA polymerase sigma factor (sigma-70 family)